MLTFFNGRKCRPCQFRDFTLCWKAGSAWSLRVHKPRTSRPPAPSAKNCCELGALGKTACGTGSKALSLVALCPGLLLLHHPTHHARYFPGHSDEYCFYNGFSHEQEFYFTKIRCGFYPRVQALTPRRSFGAACSTPSFLPSPL
jgi:hypothetical protein